MAFANPANDETALPAVFSFPPLTGPGARLLILGSMPGRASLAAGQYYAHPRNAFWPIMGELFGASPALPYAWRAERLVAAGVAVWDVLAACRRDGSLDAAIVPDSMVVNDFAAFFATQPAVTHVFFNGGTAAQVFRRRVAPELGDVRLTCQQLPSTSPAHAGRPLAEKLERWRQALMTAS